MAIAFINSIKAGLGINGGTTGTVNMTGATLLTAWIGDYTGGATSTLTDSNGNTWTKEASYTSAESRITLWHCDNPTVGSSMTFTVSGSGAYSAVIVEGWSGADATPFEQIVGNTQNAGTSVQTGSLTPGASGYLVLTGLSINRDQSGFLDVDSGLGGWSAFQNQEYNPGVNESAQSAYQIQTTATAVNPQWNWSVGGTGAAAVASFKVGSGGGGTTNGTLASTPAGTCAFVGSSTASSTFASTPSTACAWTGAMLKTSPWKGGQGFPNGVTTVLWEDAIAYFNGVLASTPTAVCVFIGALTASSTWASTPSTTCSFVNVSSGVFASTPSVTCSFVGLVQDQGIFASTPSASCSFTSIGYSVGTLAATPSASCAFVGERVTDLSNYLRRYLNDQSSMSVVGTAEDLDTSTEDDDTSYIRRYLNDKV